MNLYDRSRHRPIDLSIHNEQLRQYDLSASANLASYIHSTMQDDDTVLPIGGYLEQRAIYQRSLHFEAAADRRDIHLGIDIWAAAGSPVHAIADGVVHSFADNVGLGNYGPTILLYHEALGVYSLYGHLSKDSLDPLVVGQTITKGQILAYLGDVSVNGDYPPHLHLQIIRDIGDWQGDYPGVCNISDLAFYKSNCPNPMTYLP